MKCCSRDIDNDGNCDIHASPGVKRVDLKHADEQVAALLSDMESLLSKHYTTPEQLVEPLTAMCQRYKLATVMSALLQQTIRLRSRR